MSLLFIGVCLCSIVKASGDIVKIVSHSDKELED